MVEINGKPVIQHRTFHDDTVQSVGWVPEDGLKRYTLGIMLPGNHKFTAKLGAEHVTVLRGGVVVNGKLYDVGETAIVPKDSEAVFEVPGPEPFAYMCIFVR